MRLSVPQRRRYLSPSVWALTRSLVFLERVLGATVYRMLLFFSVGAHIIILLGLNGPLWMIWSVKKRIWTAPATKLTTTTQFIPTALLFYHFDDFYLLIVVGSMFPFQHVSFPTCLHSETNPISNPNLNLYGSAATPTIRSHSRSGDIWRVGMESSHHSGWP